jgi:hypothetical protein
MFPRKLVQIVWTVNNQNIAIDNEFETLIQIGSELIVDDPFFPAVIGIDRTALETTCWFPEVNIFDPLKLLEIEAGGPVMDSLDHLVYLLMIFSSCSAFCGPFVHASQMRSC